MIRILRTREADGRMKFFLSAGNSRDVKPAGKFQATGSLFIEVDTGTLYAYEEEAREWYAQKSWLPFIVFMSDRWSVAKCIVFWIIQKERGKEK